MIRKIVSSIIIIMIICSTYTYANNTIATEPSTDSSQENNNLNSGNENTNSDNNNGTDQKTNQDSNVDNSNSNNTNNNDINNNVSNEVSNNDNVNNNNNTNIDNNDTNNTNKPSNEQSENNQSNSGKVENVTEKPLQSGSIITNTNTGKKSGEARLKELQIDIEGMTPEFNKNTTEYYIVVNLDVEKIKVKAISQDDKAKVSIVGNNNLQEGENIISINVTAEDGTTKTYYIYVTKVDDVEMANAKLETLEIEGFNLYPSFKSDIYTYNLNIDKDIKELNINAKPEREKAVVQIIGNTDLHKGENMIEIKVTAEDGLTIRTYKINTYINSDKVKIQEESKLPAIILIILLGIVALGIYINKRKK